MIISRKVLTTILCGLVYGGVGACALTGCDDSDSKKAAPDPGTQPIVGPEDKPVIAEWKVALSSTSGCQLDSDCVKGAFCYHSTCTTQCNADKPCASGFICSEDTGRCVDMRALNKMRRKLTRDLSESSESSINQVEADIMEAEASNVISSVLGQTNEAGEVIDKIDFVVDMPSIVQASKGDKTVSVSFTTANDIGTVHYILRDINENAASDLQTATVQKEEVTVGGKQISTYKYSFVLPSEKAGSDSPENETYTIDSAAGAFVVTVRPRPTASGTYAGYVAPTSILSGIDLPLRMAIKTVPETPASFTDIQSIEVMLPVSSNDLFSPATPGASESWLKVSAAPEGSSQCKSEKPCFAAVFSSNNFVVPGSKLIDSNAKINRSIRIEITYYDSKSQTISGVLVDDLTGLYRVNDANAEGVDRVWNVADMVGEFSLRREGNAPESAEAHDAANMELRDISSEPTAVCNDNSLKDLFALVPRVSKLECETIPSCSQEYLDACAEDMNSCTVEEIDACKKSLDCKAEVADYNRKAANCAITSTDGYNLLSEEEKSFCLITAADTILSDESRLSAILAGVLTDNGDQTEAGFPVDTTCNETGEIHSFSDFAAACIKEGCGLCADRPEIACAADLIARVYLGLDKSTPVEDKAALMDAWLDLMHESYLGQQYVAWSQDTSIRRDWLEGAVYNGTFAASIMDEFNEGLLTKYRQNVLDANHDVMSKQFRQTSLEMLGQALEDTGEEGITKLSSARNEVLAELGDTWSTVAESLALAARRHDILTQNDAKRIQTAAELRTYLFDLYFAGLVESNINLAAKQGSLNGTYGANLSNIITKLESLDQDFESLVFMRDGEIFTDTRVEAGTSKTALETLQETTDNSIKKAIKYRVDTFNKQDAKELKVKELEDSYRSSLEAMRTELVNLCGYPKDCEDKKTCDINTDLYYCGFLVNKSDEGGILGDESSPVSTNADVQTSQAGLAILDFRQALYDYKTANAEKEALEQKLLNNEAYYKSYKKNIETWNKNRLNLINNIKADLASIGEYEDLIGKLDDLEAKAELDAATSAATTQQSAFDKWDAVAATNLGTSLAMTTVAFAAGEGARWTEFSERMLADQAEEAYWDGLITNTSVIGAGAGTGAIATAKAHSTAQTVLRSVSYGLQSAQAAADYAKEMANLSFQYGVDHIDRQNDVDLANIEKTLQDTLYKLRTQTVQLVDENGNVTSVKRSELEGKIEELNNHIEELKMVAAQQEQYGRDCNDLKALRTEYDNLKLDLASKQYIVYVKKIGVYKAQMNYLNIVQHAELVEGQYNAKNARYQGTMKLVNSPASVFQYAKDLESVEYFIESARNDVSDYLAAIEYLTVRPFVELRRAIYTARGTNELEKIFEQLKDLTTACGSGAKSKNQVTISLRNRMGIDGADYNGITPADRFHYALQTSELPISTQTRYIVGSTVSDKLVAGSFYNGSFNLSSSFANIANSCNATIDEIQVRFVSKPGKKIRESGDAAPSITLFYGGQSQLLSCHAKIKAIASSIGPRTTYGEYSTFNTNPFGDGIAVSLFDADENYKLTQDVEFNNVTVYKGLSGYPLMATYTVLFDPNIGENKGINWNNVADIEIRITYSTGTLGQNGSECQYDI
ncbi:MAG: hypothetical protein J5818_03915 [Eggerthellaceae bacterium]|nr:hypothetical protein [Eggerthellaceae bacterium]